MKRWIVVSMLVALIAGLALAPAPAAASPAGKVEDSIAVLKDITTIPEKGLAPALVKDAAGVAIIPGVLKAGFVVGGEYGAGVLLVRGKDGGWAPPVFVSIAGGSIGWQAGAESTDVVLIFKHARSVEGILKGKFTLGANASIAAGPVGREAQAATDVQLKAEIYSYSRSRGFFAGLAIDGAALRIDEASDEAYYGKGFASAAEVVAGKPMVVPVEAKRLMDHLASFVASAGK
ncbi:MAG TPA: lipid-binding SYLF domain-containing protein [bacterium]